ncbi:MAG: helix-turn-helix transcriptional regulator [Betaproteobacteria bacterium]|nr:helix-turn-helix domain-containing protein [Betaproteobacteria bacterium]MDE1954706.1 helix-turn-helix transcriptional regulator [Betaproteobacteria bacterium]MDE2152694.1 helix-turn-helix transcriptional regulator [Betaproteobacteria bacterium]
MKKSAATHTLPFEAEDLLRELSGRIRVARRAQGLTQADLAARAGVGTQTMYAVEKGAPTVQMGYWLSVLWALGVLGELHSAVSQLGRSEGDLALLESLLPKRVRAGGPS